MSGTEEQVKKFGNFLEHFLVRKMTFLVFEDLLRSSKIGAKSTSYDQRINIAHY